MTGEIIYNPIQSKADHELPQPEDLPPISERVPQSTDPYADISTSGINRVTYQSNELCNLSCPGCFLGDWLKEGGAIRAQNERRKTDVGTFTRHIDALGPSLDEVFILGAEPTMTPDSTAQMIQESVAKGHSVMAVTNGAARDSIVDRTFEKALEEGSLHKLNISLDSIDPDTNDALRGKPGATEATLHTIARYTERGYPIKLQITVWPRNYATILETVERLYEDYGVRGFAFHCGSLESVDQTSSEFLGGHLDPLAWRALIEQLQAFNLKNFDDLEHFNFPYIYVTDEELRDNVLNDPELYQQYQEHTARLEVGHDEPLPFNACTGIGVPQVYMYANDKSSVGTGRLSACNIDTAANGRYLADFDDETGEYTPTTDNNQVAGMINSSHMCPATEQATGDFHKSGSDRITTELGDFHHVCRFLSNNQMPAGGTHVPRELYDRYAALYSEQFSTI
jgi:MoaA/NifB/PqqE/SkfB family radical SAM enzyme